MASYRPAGDDFDYSDDDDGFVLGSDTFNSDLVHKEEQQQAQYSKKDTFGQKKFEPKENNETSTKPQQRDGFGKWHKPANPVKSDKKGKILSVDDFRSAVMRGNTPAVEEYLNQGIHVDTVLKSGWTALMYAASCANLPLSTLLLNRGADSNFSKDMYTVLMAACASNMVNEDSIHQCVCFLLDHNAQVNVHDRYHMSPLIHAAREGHSSVVQKLLENAAEINKQDNRGWTALAWASSKNHLQIIQILLDAGADANKACIDGQKAVDIAEDMGYTKIANILKGVTKGRKPLALSTASSGDVDKVISNGEPGLLGVAGTQTFVKYGELRTILCGLQLESLFPVFNEHNMTCSDFLKMTDHDLKQLGITKIGDRKKILDEIQQIHKKDWEASSVTSVQYNKQISCPEAVAMLANIAKHTDYISCTVAYIKDHIKNEPKILQSGNDGSAIETVCKITEEAINNVTHLYGELTSMRSEVSQLTGAIEYSPPDLIQAKSKNMRKWAIYDLLLVAGVCVFGYWQKERITDILQNLSNKVKS